MRLLVNLEGVRAGETLRERGGEVSAETLRRLVLAATGDEAAADDACARRMLAESKRQTGG